MLDYDLTDRSVRDLSAARHWYDQRSLELGNRFIDAILATIRLAREQPESYAELKRNVRAMRCHRFPYRIYYRISGERITILAVYHTARDPNQWDNDARQ